MATAIPPPENIPGTYQNCYQRQNALLSRVLKGFILVEFTNMNNDLTPAIAAGSLVEVDGAVYITSGSAEEGITGNLYNGVNYIYAAPDGAGYCGYEYSAEPPLANYRNGGFYNAAGTKRAAGSISYKDGACVDKTVNLAFESRLDQYAVFRGIIDNATSGLEADRTALLQEIGRLRGELAVLDRRHTDKQEAYDQLEDDYDEKRATLENSLAPLEEQVNGLSTTKSTLEGEITVLNNTKQLVTQEISNLRQTKTRLAGEVEYLTTQKQAAVNAVIAEIEAQLSALGLGPAPLENQIAELNRLLGLLGLTPPYVATTPPGTS